MVHTSCMLDKQGYMKHTLDGQNAAPLCTEASGTYGDSSVLKAETSAMICTVQNTQFTDVCTCDINILCGNYALIQV